MMMNNKLFTITAITFLLVGCGNANQEESDSIQQNKVVKAEKEPLLPLRGAKPMDYFVNQIMEDSVWYSNVKDKAEERGISVDDMLKADAAYLQNEDNKIVDIENSILRNEKWFNAVKLKAENKGIPLDEQIRKEAYFLAKQNKE